MTTLFPKIKRTLATCLSFALVSTSGITSGSRVDAVPLPSLTNFFPTPPQALGFLAERHAGADKRHVILIQDLHAHLDTQKKIAGLLHFYETEGLLQRPIGLEGASGTWDLTLWNNVPLKDRKQALFDYLLEEAGLTGPEWFALNTQRPTLLKGIDSQADYTAQRMLYVQSRSAREVASQQLESVLTTLKIMVKHDLAGRALLKWQRLTRDFESGKLQADLYLRNLNELGRKIYLSPQGESLRIALNACTSAQMAQLSTSDAFYSDVRKFGQQIGLALATPAQQNLLKAHYAADLLQRMMRQQMTLQEIQQVGARPQEMALLTHQLIEASGQPAWFDTKGLLELVQICTDFYVAALVRDEPMANNTLKLFTAPALSGDRPKGVPETVILVSGGFHTAGLTEVFRKAGVSYDVITPNITAQYTAQDEARYADRMAGKPVSLARFVSHAVSTQSSDSEIRTPQSKTANDLVPPGGKISEEDPNAVSMFGADAAGLAFLKQIMDSKASDPHGHGYDANIPYHAVFTGGLGLSQTVDSDDKLAHAFRTAFTDLGKATTLPAYSRLSEIHIFKGEPKSNEPQFDNGFSLHFDAEKLFVRESIEGSDEHYRALLHEDSLKAVSDFLLGGRFYTPESAALIAAVVRFRESVTGHIDLAVRPDGKPVTHEDLVAYGATLDKVVQSLLTGSENAFIDRASKDLHILAISARLPILKANFFRAPTEENVRLLINAYFSEVDAKFSVSADRTQHLVVKALRAQLPIQADENSDQGKRVRAIPLEQREAVVQELVSQGSVSAVLGKLVSAYNQKVGSGDLSRVQSQLEIAKLIIDTLNTYPVDEGSLSFIKTADADSPIVKYDDILNPEQELKAREIREDRFVEMFQTAGMSTRLKKTHLALLKQYGITNEGEIEQASPRFLRGGMYFYNPRRVLEAIYNKQVALGKIKAGEPLDLKYADLKPQEVFSIVVDGKNYQAGSITITPEFLSELPDLHIGDLHWLTMAATIRHDQQKLGRGKSEKDLALAVSKRPVIVAVNRFNRDLLYRDLKSKNFYGFSPENLIFAEQAVHDLYTPTDNGVESVTTDEEYQQPYGNLLPFLAVQRAGGGYRILDDNIEPLPENESVREYVERVYKRPYIHMFRNNDTSTHGAHPVEHQKNIVELYVTPDANLSAYSQAELGFSEGKAVVNTLSSNPLNQKGGGLSRFAQNGVRGQSLFETLGLILRPDGQGIPAAYNKADVFIDGKNPGLENVAPLVQLALSLKQENEEHGSNVVHGIQLDLFFNTLELAGLPTRHVIRANDSGEPSERIIDFKAMVNLANAIPLFIALGKDSEFIAAQRPMTRQLRLFSRRSVAIALGVAGLVATVLFPAAAIFHGVSTGLAVAGTAYALPQAQKLFGSGNAEYLGGPSGQVDGARAAYQRVHEVSHSISGYLWQKLGVKPSQFADEVLAEFIIGPLFGWALALSMLIGWSTGKIANAFDGNAIRLTPDQAARVKALSTFISSGKVHVADISVGAIANGEHAVLPSSMWTHIWGYLRTAQMRQDELAYKKARERISESA